MYPRFLADSLLAALADTPVVLLVGARQTGKSTLVQDLIRDRHPARYLTLDDAVTLAAARTDPVAFLQGEGNVVVDEVQRAPDLFLAIKASVDRNRAPGRFLLTGSANALLLPKLSEYLAGRMEVLTLRPLSQGEIHGTKETFIDAVFSPKTPVFPDSALDRPGVFARMLRGGYPPVLERQAADRRHAWFSSYITTLLERDVRDLAQIESWTALARLMRLLASRTTALVNFAELSRTSGMPQTSLNRHVALLRAIYFVDFVPAWSGNLGKRLTKSPKLLLNDTGLAADLLGITSERLESLSDSAGALLENFVVTELHKQSAWSAVRPQLFYFRSAAGQEVDIVLEDAAGRLVGIEVKASSTVTEKDFAGLRAFAGMTGGQFLRGIVLYTGRAALPFGGNMHALPVDCLWNPAA